MAKQSMRYETVMVFSVQQGDEAVTALADKFKALISENGTIEKVEEWGKRRLAYPINDELDGFYLLVEFTSSPDFPAELDRVYKITDGVLRTLIVCKEEEDVKKPEAKAQPEAEAQQAVTQPEEVKAPTQENA